MESLDFDLGHRIQRTLADNRQRFLSFLRPLVRRGEDSEEVAKGMIVRASVEESSPPEGESVVAWLYRILRDSLVDYYSHNDRERRTLDFLGYGAAAVAEVHSDQLHAAVYACLHDLIPTLQPEHAELLRRVDLAGDALVATAATLGISAEVADTCMHRARRAFKDRLVQCGEYLDQEGRLDCSCHSKEIH